MFVNVLIFRLYFMKKITHPVQRDDYPLNRGTNEGDESMKKYIIFLVSLVMVSLAVSYKAYAEEQSLYVEAEIGFENRVKHDSPTVLNVTITNNGESFSGDFVVDAPVTYNVGSGLVFPLDIAKGETKTIPIYLDGFISQSYYGSGNSDIFYFYEGGIEKGKLVEYDGDSGVNPSMISPLSKTMIVVTTRPDELSAIEEMRKALGEELVTYYATSKEDTYLVDDYRGLSHIDIIIFDNIAMQDLSEQQQQAIYKWVQTGGVLAFSPTELAKNGAGIFKENMPLQLGNEIAVPKELFKNYSNLDAVVDEIKIYESNIAKDSLPTFQVDGYTFAAGTNIGQGKVIQFAFPLYDSVITNLRDYGQIVKNSLKIDGTVNYISSVNEVTNWKNINEVFDTFNVSVWVLVGGFFVYMMIIGPVLYRVLKKKDRREKMWLYIPVIAVVTSIMIFIIGAKDRIFSPQVQQMAIFEIGDDGSLQGTYTNSIMSNRSGDFELTMDNNTTAISSSNNGVEGERLHQKSYLKETSDGKTLSLLDFNYWSVQSVVGKTLIEDGGQLIANLTLQNKELTGTITNTLPVDLADLLLLSGANEYELGSIKAGETINVNLNVNKQFLNAPSNSYSRHNYNGGNVTHSEKMYSLRVSAVNLNSGNEFPLLVGWSDISLVPIELTGGSKQNTISYFSKPVNINVVIEDEIVLTNEDTIPMLHVNDNTTWGDIDAYNMNLAYISAGEIPLIYEMTNKEIFGNSKWNEFTINYDEENYYLSIKNNVTGELIELKDGQHVITENIEQYVNNNQIEFIIGRTFDDGTQITLPTFELKGEPIK